MTCGRYGSDDIERDACAGWNADSQSRRLTIVFHYARCQDSDAEITVQVEEASSPAPRDGVT